MRNTGSVSLYLENLKLTSKHYSYENVIYKTKSKDLANHASAFIEKREECSPLKL